MISKFYEINKYTKKINFYLFYGENEGQKLDTINDSFSRFTHENSYKYSEKDIIQNNQLFFDKIYTKSFFDSEKLILIYDISDKILGLIEETVKSDISGIKIILLAKKLEKKSKIRNFFEKNKKVLIIPFYEDTLQTLIAIGKKILIDNKISLSQENLNLIIERSQRDRINLKNELEKIVNLSKNKKKLETNDILKLTNLTKNYSASELAESCLIKNKKRTLNILNENIPSSEDNILILKTFLYKLKRLRKLRMHLNENNNIEKAINSFKPPIFWKDKNLIKQQIKIWEIDDINEFITRINNIEKSIKKNPQVSSLIINNMIFEKLENTNNLT